MNDLEVRDWVRSAKHIAVLTGAGMSAESGVPTFRDAQTGLWAKFDPQQLATEDAFRANPSMVWDWYAFRREAIARVRPNAGHRALGDFAKRHPARLTLITQNVDGLHQRAGSRAVIELHGNIGRVKCSRELTVVGAYAEGESPPRCPCGAWLRPDVVWFGELLPGEAMEQAEAAARNCEVFFSIGTSAEVYPAAELPMTARAAGAAVVEINPDKTPLTRHAHFALQGPAGVVLPELLARLQSAA